MKVAIDGFNLGLSQGTGIATYGKELATLLTGSGHNVYPIYGLDSISKNKITTNSEFIQQLGTRGESSRYDVFRWANKFVTGAGLHLLGLPFKSYNVLGIDRLALGSVREKIPHHQLIFNSPSIFRASQAFSYFTGKNTKLSIPEKIDIFHATSPLPISVVNTPKVVTVHDLIPILLPASTEVNIKHYFKMVRASILDADGVFCVSEASRRDLLNYFNIPDNKVHVTYQSAEIPLEFRRMDQNDVELFIKRQYGLNFREFFLFYGAIEPKKNVAKIIEAFLSAKTEFPLVIAGKNGWLFDDVERLLKTLKKSKHGKKRVVRIPYLPFRQLMTLVKGARGLVFPSLYEGFGLPVLEAMQMGCPVITSNVSSLPEVGGDAVHYVDPYDVSSIAAAVDKFSSDEEYTAELVKKGYVQANRFSREEYLKRLHAGYNTVIK